MKPDHFQLSIPSACQEKWNNFTPTSQGGYCSSCKKEVIDFTTWSDHQIKNFFRNHSNTCGRFHKHQLKTYAVSDPNPRRHILPMSIVGLTLLLADQAEAKANTYPVTEHLNHSKSLQQSSHPLADTVGRRKISGVVKYAEDSVSMPGVSVRLKNGDVETFTDADGRFSIDISHPNESDTLVFSFIGLITVEKSVASNDWSILLEADKNQLDVVVGGVCVRRWSPRNIWWRIRNIFR